MTPLNPGPTSDDQSYPGDPWHVFGYLVSGVALYGILGALADRWLGTTYVVGVGIVLGAGLGTYMTFKRFAAPQSPPTAGRRGRGATGHKTGHRTN